MTNRRIRLALAALVLPLGVGAASCKGGLTDSPTTTTVTVDTMVVIEGRPLRRRNGRLRRARSRRGHLQLTDSHALKLAPDVRQVLADHWREQGELEHASVIAFQDLAYRLAMVDAPDDLLRRSLHAADQEADHARRCFDLAGRYLGASLRTGRLRRPVRLHRSRTTELVRLAEEALRDGVLNEGYAAWLAEQRLHRARDRRVVETLTVIARDEAEHAALAAAVLAWCFAEGGPAVGAAVQQAANKLPSRVMSRPMALAVDAQILADHGVCQPDHDGAGFSAVLRDTLALVPDLVHAAA